MPPSATQACGTDFSNDPDAQYQEMSIVEGGIDGRRTTDQAKRIEIYKKAQKIILDEAPWIFVNQTLQVG
jgi:hypothetical protein